MIWKINSSKLSMKSILLGLPEKVKRGFNETKTLLRNGRYPKREFRTLK